MENKEARAFFNGMKEISEVGWGPMQNRVGSVAEKLIAYSGQTFKIVPGQTYQWGVAHAGGWIILDISSAASSDPILAFRLAHEWGHEALGHQPNWYHPFGGAWQFRPMSTTAEDEADAYAGRFLATYKYPLKPVLDELATLPISPGGDTHSSGAVRAGILSKAYANASTRVPLIGDGEVCNAIKKIFSFGPEYLRRAMAPNPKTLLNGFYCSPSGEGSNIAMRCWREIDEGAHEDGIKDLALAVKACLADDLTYVNSYIGRAWSDAETKRSVFIASARGEPGQLVLGISPGK